MIFIDSNIPMYLIGVEHPNKQVARRRLEEIVADGEALVSDVEVLQEILHRYHAIGRLDAVQPAFDALTDIVDELFSLDRAILVRAKEIVLGGSRSSARDALHVATMEAHGVSRVLTFDAGFDAYAGITRV